MENDSGMPEVEKEDDEAVSGYKKGEEEQGKKNEDGKEKNNKNNEQKQRKKRDTPRAPEGPGARKKYA